jgi:predicted nucleic acid-binding protein
MRILLDLNIIMDVLTHREPHYHLSAQVWAAVESGRCEGLLAAHSITTLFYLLSRQLDRQRAVLALHDILRIFAVAAVDQHVITTALALGWRDFEDAVQMAAAIQAGADYLVTRNPADFRGGTVTVLQPGELIALI